MSETVLQLLEGLTEEQVKAFMQRVMPTLQELRRVIVEDNAAEEKPLTTLTTLTTLITLSSKARWNQGDN